MNAQELRCPGCFAPIAPTQIAISKCRYCGATIAIQGAVPAVAPPPHDPGYVPVFLEDAGHDKISVIKVIREFTGVGLREAKDLCERAPCIVFNWPGEPTKTRDFRLALARAGARVR